MKTARQAQREARQLYHLCLVDGRLDESRVRHVVARMVGAGHAGGLAVLTRFERLVRLDRDRHSARVESAQPLPPEVRGSIESGLAGLYGPDLVISFEDDPALLGGVRIQVGSDVYDGSVRGGLAALEAKLQ
jgi:F-type H+-transporting ATPase subunit delta